MQNTLEQMITYGRGSWRYRWYAMAVAWVIVLAGWIAVSRIPDRYTADAQIHVDAVTILRPLLKGLVVDENNTTAQLGLMTQLLLSRPYLEKVAQIVGFDPQTQTPQQLETTILRLKKNISISGSRTNPSTNYLDLYTISCTDGDPEIAKRVVQALIDTFVEETLGKGRQDSDTARQFLEGQIKEYEERLIVAEDRLREFKRQHVDELPEQGSGYYERLQAARAAIDDIELQIHEAESQRNEVQRQLEGTAAGQRAVSVQGTPVLTPAESRLMALQTQLDQLLLKYTEAHPDVVATQRMMADLEKQRETEVKELASGTTSSATVPNPEHLQLKLKLRELETALAALQAKQEEYSRRIQALQQQREKIAIVETDLQRLNRDYEINRERYNALVARRESMRMSENVQQAEEVKFEIVAMPNVWMGQTLRKRIMLVTGVLATGLGGGVMLAFLLSQVRPVVHSRHALSELTGLPVFGAISQAQTLSTQRRRRLDIAGFILVSLLMLVTYGAVLFGQVSKIGWWPG